MNCNEFESQLNVYIDGNLQGDALEDFERHLSQCALCSMLLENAIEAKTLLTNIPEVEPSGDLFQRIISSTTGKRKHLRPNFRQFPFFKNSFTLRIAASILFVLFLVSVYYNRSNHVETLRDKSINIVTYFDYAGNRVFTGITRFYINAVEAWDSAISLKDEVENFFRTHWEQVKDIFRNVEKPPEAVPSEKKKNIDKSTFILNKNLKNA